MKTKSQRIIKGNKVLYKPRMKTKSHLFKVILAFIKMDKWLSEKARRLK